MGKKSKQAQNAPKPAPVPEPSLKEQADKAFAKGSYEDALSAYNRAIQSDSKNYLLYSNRSACYMALEDYDQALKDAERVIQLCPTWPKGHFRKGMALEQLLSLKEALQAYNTGLSHAPSDSLLKQSSEDLTQLLEKLRIAEQTMLQEDNLRPSISSSSSSSASSSSASSSLSIESKEKPREEVKEKAVETKTETGTESDEKESKEAVVVVSKHNDNGQNKETEEKATEGQEDKEETRKKREAYAVYQRMVKWLKNGGARFPKLYLRSYSSSYRGVHVLSDVPKDECVLAVPERFIVTSDMAKASDIGRSIVASGLDLRSHHTYLASFLLQERHKSSTSTPSFFAPFLPTLPTSFPSLPTSFSEDELRHLQGSFCLDMISNRVFQMQQEFQALRRYVKEYANFSFEEFEWARRVVITRVFGLTINGAKTDGLVPFADMFNHRPPREAARDGELCADTTWGYNDKRKAFTVALAHSVKAKQQIFDSYGRKCNSRFFVNYGFTLDHNPDNEAVMRVEIPLSDPLFNAKKQLLGVSTQLVQRQYQVPSDVSDKKVANLFGFMRLAHASETDMVRCTATATHTEKKLDVESVRPLSLSNELAVLQSLQQAAKEALRAFPTTLEEDQKLLDAGIDNFNVRNCVVMRKGEKEVLTFYATLYDRMRPLFQMTPKKLKVHVANLLAGHRDGKRSPAEAYLLRALPDLVDGSRYKE